ncbi:MAG: FecR domain-containing protein [Tannerella sp.]|jgi:ferric-dicitrate binding protein FerR (iron transport regulator)|nr:FecR domain-containing protein [Tannerella sp.]
MVIKEKENIITDMAWERLHERFKQDGLLPETNAPERASWRVTSRPEERHGAKFIAWAATVAVLLTAVFSALYITGRANDPGKKLLVLHNEANAPTLATMLRDGSVVYLSEQTSLQYPDRFAGDRREVILSGEAFFEVNRNDGCPFFVDTDPATIEVTGTAFNVKSKDRSSFLLSVRDGEVRVSLKNRRQSVFVKAGETVFLDAERQLLSKTDSQQFDGNFKRIHFKDERLGNIIAIINTHSDSIRIKIDPELENRLLTIPVTLGNNLPEIAEIICLVLNLRRSHNENIIYISKKE